MRLQIAGSKKAPSLYIVESTYDSVTGKRSNRVVEKLGTLEELSRVHEDPIAWGRELAKTMTLEEKENKDERIVVSYNPSGKLNKGNEALFQGGYLFLQKIYYDLGLDKICQKISDKYKFEYDLNDILRVLVYGRILFPKSKRATYEEAKGLLEPPGFESHDTYRALEVLARENEFIQSELYKNSKKVLKRKDNILFYDCTNFFFELEEEEGLKQYGRSKENRPNPIVQMGLFMDADGIPLAFCLHPGNTNEQQTLKPLEQQIIRDFDTSRFVVCTDAGLSSLANRKFNSIQDRAFITTQSLKKLKAYQKQWALAPEAWKLFGDRRSYNLDDIRKDKALQEKYWDKIFYKERWFNEQGLEQRYIVTFSLKYMAYTQAIRLKQVSRASKMVDSGRASRKGVHDPARFVQQLYIDEDGSICETSHTYVSKEKIQNEAQYDGFYCSATNLEDDAGLILKVNRQRWEMEESFRIMKSEFKARPVFLSRDDRITAHFMTCFLALYVFRFLEKKLGEAFTCEDITKTLRKMSFLKIPQEGYVPAYTRSDLTDALHDTAGFYTDYEILSMSQIGKVIKQSKKR